MIKARGYNRACSRIASFGRIQHSVRKHGKIRWCFGSSSGVWGIMHTCWRWNLGSCDRCVLFHWATSQLSGFNFGISVYNQRMNLWGLVMSQWVKALTTTPDTASSVPEAHTVKGKNQFLEVALCSPHSLSVMSVFLHTLAHIRIRTPQRKTI